MTTPLTAETRTPPILNIDINAARTQILDPACGAFVVRGAVDPATLDRYLEEAEAMFEHGPRRREKPTVDGQEDFIIPWIYDHGQERFTVHRLYRFTGNEAGTTHGGVHVPIMRTRDAIEAIWPNEALYAEKGLRNVHLITKYEHGAEGYPRHTDVPFPYDHPLLQCWLQLSRPGVDFGGGDLILHPAGGPSISAFNDLKIDAGDVMFFDKRVEHEVTPCEPREHGRGRWIGIVGAMAPMAAGVSEAA